MVDRDSAQSGLLIALMFFAAALPAFAQDRPVPSTLFPLDRFWSIALEAPFAAAPAVDDRRVYVPLQTGQLVAFEPGRDEPVWSREIAVDAPPAAGGGLVFVHAAEAIHALDAATGVVRWRLPSADLAVAPVHRAGWLFVALADGTLQAIRANDGAVIWTRPMGSPLASPPSIDGNAMAVAFIDGRLALLDVATGAQRWPRSLGTRPGGITLSGDRIFVATDDGQLWSVKTRDGSHDWRFSLGSRIAGAPAVDAERVYAIAFDNIVRGFSRGGGNVDWTYPIPTRALAGPILIDDLVVITNAVVGEPGLIYINAETGAAAGKTPALVPAPQETTRVQFPVAISAPTAPPGINRPRFAIIATATTAGAWQLHAYRQTFLTAVAAPIVWGKRYEVRRRLEVRTGAIIWGQRVPLVPLVPLVPEVRFQVRGSWWFPGSSCDAVLQGRGRCRTSDRSY